ncbi:MAG: UDP-N-acetylglucosamine 2-epimerase (non-hydrolyzing) [Pontixanthobacter sp.]
MIRPITIATIFGTRPEAIKLFPVIHALQVDSRFDCRVCVTGQHRDLLDSVLAFADIVPDYDLDVMRPDQSLDALTASLLTDIGTMLDRDRPDWVIVQGDTTSAFCGALAAYYRKIPIAHVEAGLRSGDNTSPWPEEGNRKIIAAIAALHFAPTQSAAIALRSESIASDTIHVTGNTAIDALYEASDRLHSSTIYGALEDAWKSYVDRKIIGVTCHRRENFGPGLALIADAIGRIAEREDVAIIFPLHPNPNVRRVMEERLDGLDNVVLLDPLDYPQFVHLLQKCTFMLTDSGGVQEEAPAFGKPVLVMRDTTERPEGLAAGTSKLVGTDPAIIVSACHRLLDDPFEYRAMAKAHSPFGDGKAAARIVEVLANAGIAKAADTPSAASYPRPILE